MGSFANTLFTMMLGWLQAAAATIWSAFTTENGGTFLQWIGNHWIVLALILCAAGVTIDFGIYLLRWRPIKVWKSFFRRIHHGDEQTERDTGNTTASSGPLFKPEPATVPRRIAEKQAPDMRSEQEDFSRWKTEEEEMIPADEPPAREKRIITGAGYSVPADSPYRRPAAEPAEADNRYRKPVEPAEEDSRYRRPAEPAEAESRYARPTEPEAADNRYRRLNEPPAAVPVQEPQRTTKPEIMTQRRKRRRLIMSDLFSDPEEELYQYEKPQQLIDREKAYHQPVYPKGWKKDEGDEQ